MEDSCQLASEEDSNHIVLGDECPYLFGQLYLRTTKL